MSQAEKDKVRAKDRERKSCEFVKEKAGRNKKLIKEIKKIDTLLKVRLCRSLQSEEDRIKFRNKAKVQMSSRRKNGYLRKYKQRTKRDAKEIQIWRDFFRRVNLDLFICETPRLLSLHKKLNSMKKEIRAMENKERQEAQMYARMAKWTPGRAFKQKLEESRGVCKKIMDMRKHRKKIKEVIKDYEKLRKSSCQAESWSTDAESDDDDVSENGDIDIYS